MVFETPDRLQHWAWRAIAELIGNDGGLARTPLHEAVEACYREMDRVVGRLLDEAAGPETHVFFVSDHGFGPLRRRFHVDQWLAEQGWLTYESGKATVRQRLRGPLKRVKRFLPRSLVRTGRRTFAVSRIIQWERTLAYSGRTMEHAMYVNLQGRDPQGIVPPEEFDALRRRIAEALVDLRDPNDGQPVVEAATLREDCTTDPTSTMRPTCFSASPRATSRPLSCPGRAYSAMHSTRARASTSLRAFSWRSAQASTRRPASGTCHRGCAADNALRLGLAGVDRA